MRLQRLTLSGFKSFARSTSLDFTTPITAVVGPNGAGKSNIAEAIRFVLGEQSIKTLRGKRGEDLIFNGTKQVSRLNRAHVTIAFDNKERKFPIDFDEVLIKRVVHRDGTSQYYINNTLTRLKDIIELLSSAYIGASNHHIIGQGEADRILNASPKDRRAMIEDSLGLKVFQYKKAESEKRLLKTKENIAHVNALKKEVLPHLQFLEKQVEKIKQAEVLREKLQDLYSTYLCEEDRRLGETARTLLNEKKGPEEEIKKIEKDIECQKSVLAEQEKGKEQSHEVSSLEQTLDSLRRAQDSCSRELGRVEGMIEYKKKSMQSFLNTGAAKDAVVVPHRVFSEMREKIEAQFRYAAESHDMHILREVFAILKEELRTFFDAYGREETFEGARAKEEKELEALVQEKNRNEEEQKRLEKEIENTYTEYQNKKGEIEKDRTIERSAERRLFELQNRRTELSTKLELLRVREERQSEDRLRFQNEFQEAVHLFGNETITKEMLKKMGASTFSRDNQDALRREVEKIKYKIEDIGSGGAEIIKEYEEVKERDTYLGNEIEDLEKSASSLQDLIGELGEKISAEFHSGLQHVNKKFQEFFKDMFDGGSASLTVTEPQKTFKKQDDFDDFEHDESERQRGKKADEAGIDITVSLPKKRIRGLAMLSGGERSLTSIALIFAMTQVNPPPFLVLDETDAALDEANSKKYGTLLESLSQHTQFIVITHNRATMARSGILYGVTTSGDGTSRILSVKLKDAVQMVE